MSDVICNKRQLNCKRTARQKKQWCFFEIPAEGREVSIVILTGVELNGRGQLNNWLLLLSFLQWRMTITIPLHYKNIVLPPAAYTCFSKNNFWLQPKCLFRFLFSVPQFFIRNHLSSYIRNLIQPNSTSLGSTQSDSIRLNYYLASRMQITQEVLAIACLTTEMRQSLHQRPQGLSGRAAALPGTAEQLAWLGSCPARQPLYSF